MAFSACTYVCVMNVGSQSAAGKVFAKESMITLNSLIGVIPSEFSHEQKLLEV